MQGFEASALLYMALAAIGAGEARMLLQGASSVAAAGAVLMFVLTASIVTFVNLRERSIDRQRGGGVPAPADK